MKSSDIRHKFLDFFEKKGHKKLPSASLIPSDPTVLLTLAGMLPFKPIFLGVEKPKYKRVTTSQKCIRMNDLERVGQTTRHHTFFEMLGNFSFGDYFKEEAIFFAWEFLTEVLKIEKERLVVAVYEKDDEAFGIWEKKIGIPSSRLYRLDAENNFWAAGPTGPCGPCSEIYYDYGGGCGKETCNPSCECERFLEIWNLVFIEYNRNENGELLPLPKKNIDTGMGLERISRIMQGKKDNFDTDLFDPIFAKLPDKSSNAKVVADHIRAITHLISDSVLPSNEGRGYVLRRIIRRAVLFGKKLNLKSPFLSDLADVVVETGKDYYPDLQKNRKIIEETLKIEENNFNLTLDSGMKMLDKLFVENEQKKIISGLDAFKLHDTYGFPIEITLEIASEKGFKVDIKEFEKHMDEQKERARAKASKISESALNLKNVYEEKYGKTSFIGYDKFESESKILEILEEENIVILDKTPFYPEGGGQAGDVGVIGGNVVEGTYGEIGGIIMHKLKDVAGLKEQSKVNAKIDIAKRRDTTAHHTGTHLLQSALRKVLGDSVKQAGSSVGPERLRFDFTFNRALTQNEIYEIEKIVNEFVKESVKVDKIETSYEEAQKMGAIALFTEKYGDTVRVIKIEGISTEFCGGCHVNNTSEVGFFKIIKEEALQSGVRRIEAVSGTPAKIYVMQKLNTLKAQIEELMCHHTLFQAKKELLGGGRFLEAEIFTIDQTELLNIPKAVSDLDVERVNKFLEHLQGRLDWIKDRNRNLQKEICDLDTQKSLQDADLLLEKVEEIKGVKVLKAALCEASIDTLRAMADKLKNSLKSGIIILASTISDKVSFLVVVTDDLVLKGYNAGKIAKTLSQVCLGGGGGKPNKAEAGGKDPTKINEAFEKVLSEL